MKNDNDLTARQMLRAVEIQIFRSDFETAAYSSMRSLFTQLSIECCFFHFGEANWRNISELLNSDAHPNIWKFLEFLKREQSNTELRKQALHRGESLSKKSSKAVSREKRLQKIVSEFQMKTNNGHTCMDYLERLAHNVTY